MDSFKEGETVSWTNKKGDFTGKIIKLKDYFAIIESEEKKTKVPYKILKKIIEDEDLLRAQSIAENGFNTGRNPLDTSGMDTDDEEWLEENIEWGDYILDYYNSLKENDKDDLDKIKSDLEKNGFCIIPEVLDKDEIEFCKESFKDWRETIPNHDEFHKTCNPNNIYKYHRVGHTKMAWYIRTRPKIQDIYKKIWNTDELVVSFDGACYIKSDVKNNNKLWTHVDQGAESSELKCYQGFVSLTDNTQKTLRVYEGSHLLHKSYFEEKGITKTGNWTLIDKDYLDKIEDKKRVLNVPAGSLVLWDSRCFHQNQIGEDNGEDRLVQYICYLPKSHPKNTEAMKKKRLKYYKEQRTTSHWPCPIKVNGLQPRTFGNDDILIDYDSLPMNDLSEYEKEIMKII
tara:strand:+ start:340 stop:1536 length:1197 start_codon:yes stop_codon:yes gene_type:complete